MGQVCEKRVLKTDGNIKETLKEGDDLDSSLKSLRLALSKERSFRGRDPERREETTAEWKSEGNQVEMRKEDTQRERYDTTASQLSSDIFLD